MAIERFEQLVVWQKAHEVTLWVYRRTADFPQRERYGLVSQMRRAAVSVPANIAEGFKRRGTVEKRRFYNIAHASLEELRYYLILSTDLGYLSQHDEVVRTVEEVGRMLTALTQPRPS